MPLPRKHTEEHAAVAEARRALGPAGVIVEPGEMTRYLVDWAGDARGSALTVLRPASVAEVQVALRICRAHRLGVVPQGGNTGLAAGGFGNIADAPVILSLERMNAIRDIAPADFSMRVDAGCTLQQVKDAAEAADRIFPLSLGAQGSCRIGGNAATNAGGINVLRYGMARDLILGLEVVLPDGEAWDGMTGLRKDNRGYDFKQFFIGAEGTLGVITGVELKLFPRPRRVETAYVGLRSFADAMELFARARTVCFDLMTAFEVIGSECLPAARLIDASIVAPVAEALPVHVIIECASSEAINLSGLMETLLQQVMETELVVDAVLAQSDRQARAFWAIREGLVEGQARRGYHVRSDISVRLGSVANLIAAARANLETRHPGWISQVYGHAGDGNVHFNVLPPAGMDEEATRKEGEAITAGLYAVVGQFGGSISAEHGVGRSRRDAFWAGLSPVHRRLVATIKSALDPEGLMNPGCLIPLSEDHP
jgi:FAD/FMN-containing dehydrogenase